MKDFGSLIESQIDGIFFDTIHREVHLNLTCHLGGNSRRRLTIRGVLDFVANEMRLQNIIENIRLYNGNELNAATVLFSLMRGREPSEPDLQWRPLLDTLELIRNNKLALIEIVPVYGSHILVLAETIELEDCGDSELNEPNR